MPLGACQRPIKRLSAVATNATTLTSRRNRQTGADKAKLAVAGAARRRRGRRVLHARAAGPVAARRRAAGADDRSPRSTFFTSEPGKQLIAYGRDSVREVKKVVWPTRKEAMQMTGYVFAFVVVMALFLWLTDKTLEWVLYDLILGWKR